MKNYRIMRSVYIDKDGVEQAIFYYIEKLERFFWGKYWKTITHNGDFTRTVNGKEITKFSTYDEANEFIINVLSKDIPRQTRISKLAGHVDI